MPISACVITQYAEQSLNSSVKTGLQISYFVILVLNILLVHLSNII